MLSALHVHPNSYFLDVLGNIGMWTLAAAAANHQSITPGMSFMDIKDIFQLHIGSIFFVCKSVKELQVPLTGRVLIENGAVLPSTTSSY